MEHHHHKTSSRDIFSFPSTPSTQDQDSDFEFGCFTPDYSPYKNSPADHLFCNGRLLPHSFPLQQKQQRSSTAMASVESTSISRATSRTSSISSKDSLVSSRSNSVNSSRSSVSCSSARTSSSDNSERRLLYHSRRVGSCRSVSSSSSSTPVASKAVMAQLYGSSQRWQHIMPAGPSVLKREDSRRKSSSSSNNNNNYNGGILVKQGFNGSKKEGNKEKKKSYGFCLRFVKSILVACRECHSMELSINDDILQDGVKI